MVHLGEVCKDQVSSGPPGWSTSSKDQVTSSGVRYVRIRSGPVVVHLGEVCKDQVRASSGPPR